MVKSHESVSIDIERALKKVIKCKEQFGLKLVLHPELDHYLSVIDKNFLVELAESMNAHLVFEPNDNMHVNEFQFYSTITNSLIEE
jgi:ribonuclease G